jgi:hypothetical protein
MANREFEQAIAAEVENWEGASVSFEMGGVHPKAKLEFGGLIQKRAFPGTPGDRRSLANTLADMRRTLRGMGAARGAEATAEEDEAVAEKIYRKPPPPGPSKADLVQPEPIEPKPDVVDQLVGAGVVTQAEVDAARVAPRQEVFFIGEMVEGEQDDAAKLEDLRAQVAAIVDGIYFGLPDTVYHAVPRLSASGLQKLCVSPATFWAGSWLDPDRPDLDEEATKAQVLGKAYHTARLEPELFEALYARKPHKSDFPKEGFLSSDDKVKAALKACGQQQTFSGETTAERAQRLVDAGYEGVVFPLVLAEFEAERGGRIALEAKAYDDVVRDMKRIRHNGEVAELLSNGQAEVSIFWTDQHGLKMKSRVDYLQADSWADFKTFDNTRGKVLAQALADAMRYNRYHVQAVTYRDAIEAIRTGGLQIVGEATDAQRALVAAIQIRPGELACWYVFQEKGGVPNLLAREFPFYNVPLSTQFNRPLAKTKAHAEAAEAATRRKSGLHVRAIQDVDKAKRDFVLYSQVYEPGHPWFPIEPVGEFDDSDFNQYWLEGKTE